MSAKRSRTGNAKNFSDTGRARPIERPRKTGSPKNLKSLTPKTSGTAAHNTYCAGSSAERLPAANNSNESGAQNGSTPSARRLFYEQLPAAVRDIVMAPALMKHESPEAYFELGKLLVAELAPRNIIEWLWVKDFIDYTWDILRSPLGKAHSGEF